jgi:hypothetical protein
MENIKLKRNINQIWKSIIDKFGEIYYVDVADDNELVSDQVKARGSNPYSSFEFRNFSPILSWEDAENKFKKSLTEDELNSIKISYKKEEYADEEEHDVERIHKKIIVSNINKMKGGGSIKSKGTFKPLGSAKELGIKPKIDGHDMIAKCDCGEKFSYQNSKKNIVWECPECNGMKRINETKR